MQVANTDSSEDTAKATDGGTDGANVTNTDGVAEALIAYSPEMNQEIMRQLAEANAMVLAKVGSLSLEQQTQFHALIEQSNLIEANGHLNS
jgi:hypothetical protein